MTIIDYVNKHIHGRVALNGDDQAELLMRVARRPGLHIEIGCLWGGTAILAALAKKQAQLPGEVLSIDFMFGGFWNTEDPDNHKQPALDDVYWNALKFNVADRISLWRINSYPWPLAPHIHPVTALIDGAHDRMGVLHDWESLKDITDEAIIFHDYHMYYPGVMDVVDNFVRKDPNWQAAAHIGRMIVFERNHD
jgi:hypothetical protein